MSRAWLSEVDDVGVAEAAVVPADCDVEPQLLRARVAEFLGARLVAIEVYEGVRDHFPNTPAAEVAGAKVLELRAERYDLN